MPEGLNAGPDAARLDADDLARPEIEHRLAVVHHRLDEWPLTASHRQTASDLLSPGETPRRARLDGELALLAHRRGEFTRSASLGTAALERARQTKDRLALAQSANVLGMLAALNNLARLLADMGRLEGPWPRPSKRSLWVRSMVTGIGWQLCIPIWRTCSRPAGETRRRWST